MADHKVAINNMNTYSGKISSIAGDARQHISSLENSLDSLSQDWNGKSYASFSANYGTVLFHLHNVDQKMLEISNAMNIIAENYKKADETPTK